MSFDEPEPAHRLRHLMGSALYTGSVPDQALSKALEPFDLCACAETLAELEEVLRRGKFDRYRDRESRSAFAATMRRFPSLRHSSRFLHRRSFWTGSRIRPQNEPYLFADYCLIARN